MRRDTVLRLPPAASHLPIKVVRIFNTYGPRITRTTAAWSRASSCRPSKPGHHPLRRRRADAVLLLRRRPHTRPRQDDGHRAMTSSAPSTSATRPSSRMRELAELIKELTGSRSKIVHRPLPQDDPRQRRPDISEAQRLLGWRPVVPLKEGLERTIPYFERAAVAAGRLAGGSRYDDGRRRFSSTGGAGYVGSHACKALAKAGYLPDHLRQPLDGSRELRTLGAARYGRHPRLRDACATPLPTTR